MTRRALLPILLAFLCIEFPATAAAAVGDWTSYTFSNSVTGLSVDGGSLWWATTGGAVRTDLGSLETTVFHRGRGTLVSDTLSSVCVAGDSVWFGSSDRAISGYDKVTGKWRRIQGIDGLPDSRIQALACSGSSVWVGTPRGFAEFRNGVATANSCTQGVDLGCGLVSFDIRAILLTQDARWFGTALGVSRWRWTAGTWDTLNTGLSAGAVTSLVDLGGEVWAVASETPYRFDGSEWTPAASGLGGATARRLAVLGGDLYAATSAGLYRWSGGWSRVGFQLDVTSAAMDGTGRLWAGTAASGAFWWDGAVWHQVLAPGPRDDKVIRSLAVGSDGTLWFSERYPVLERFGNGVWQKFDAGSTGGSLEGQWTSALEFALNGDLWIGHCCCAGDENCRMDRLSPSGTWSNFPAMIDVIAMDQDPSGDFWLGTEAANESDTRSGVYFFSHEDSTVTKLLPGEAGGCLPSNQFPAILAPADGRVVLGSLGDGVVIWDYGSSIADLSDDDCTRRYRASTGELPSDEVTALLWRGGDLWVGTTAGIAVIDVATGDRRVLDTSSGLAGSQVSGLASDPYGHVWVTTTTGVSEVTVGPSGDTIQNFGYPDLVNAHANAVAVDARSGLVWFGTDRGLSSYQAWSPGGGSSSRVVASVYPNPFRPNSTGGLRLLASGGGVLHGEIYDVSGRRVFSFVGKVSGDIVWDGVRSSGTPAPSGHYVIVFRSDSGATATAHVALLR
jgi:hypothetical protein